MKAKAGEVSQKEMAWPNFHLKKKLCCMKKNEPWGGNNVRKAIPGSPRRRWEAGRSRAVRLAGVEGQATGLANGPEDAMRTGPAASALDADNRDAGQGGGTGWDSGRTTGLLWACTYEMGIRHPNSRGIVSE